MTDHPPKRRFWQIHLSTAVLMMILFGVLLGLNLRPPRIVSQAVIPATDFGDKSIRLVLQGEGWSISRFNTTITYPAYTINNGWTPEFQLNDFASREQPGDFWSKRWANISVNVLVCLALLTIALVSCEYLTRRRPKL
jgi:hypothetical protein